MWLGLSRLYRSFPACPKSDRGCPEFLQTPPINGCPKLNAPIPQSDWGCSKFIASASIDMSELLLSARVHQKQLQQPYEFFPCMTLKFVLLPLCSIIGFGLCGRLTM